MGGFKMDSTPLFQVNMGAEWYLHTIYTVRSSSKKVRRHAVIHQERARERRAVSEQVGAIGTAFNRGKNMHPIQLLDESEVKNMILAGESSTSWLLAAILGAVLLGLLVFIVVRRRRRDESEGYRAGARAKSGSVAEDYKPIDSPPKPLGAVR